jgi:DNA-binding NarL/FixJ family response regulator
VKRARILLGDDHFLVLYGSRALLQRRHEIVGTASDGQALVAAAIRLKPDLVVLDISMPLLSGIEAARQIKKALGGVKIVFLTMHTERSYVQSAFEAGALGYLLKTAGPEELLEGIEKVLEGQLCASPELALNLEHLRDPMRAAQALQLTPRERQVLQLIAEGHSAKQIAHILDISVKTTSFHRENIKRKLSVKTIAELTRNAMALGLVTSAV